MASDGGGGGGEVSVAVDPDFAAVCSFLQVFGSACALEVPSISDLQRILEDTQEVSETLRDLHLKLLRRALKSVQPERWERGLIKFCHQHGLHKEAWELDRFSYKKSSTRVKLTILKVLLEYQFTCHVKFKNAVNTRTSAELRLEPVGRDRGGRVYWLHTDAEANLRLYREDQDEETWSLIARDREGLVKVINQLKSGEETNTVSDSVLNEDSNSLEISLSEKKNAEENEDSNEEFLSPESESEHESDSMSDHKHDKEKSTTSINESELKEDLGTKESSIVSISTNKEDVEKPEMESNCDKENEITQKEDVKTTVTDTECTENVLKNEEPIKNESEKFPESNADEEVGPAIEEPVMLVTGEGNGADCESAEYSTWEEISEPIMYFWGEGWGADCSTGNPGETTAEVKFENKINDDSAVEHDNKNDLGNITKANNGGVSSDVDSNTSCGKKITNIDNSTDQNEHMHQSVTKRLLQENCLVNDNKTVESTPKKPCIWNVESIVRKSESSEETSPESNTSGITNTKDEKQTEKSEENGCNYDDKSPVSTTSINFHIEKCSEEIKASDSIDINESAKKDVNSINLSAEETKLNTEQSDKKNIIEKRKSSLSSEDEKQKISETEKISPPVNKKQAGKHKAKLRNKGNAKNVCKPDVESLPSKKLRLDSSTDDCDKETSEKSTVVDGPRRKYEKEEQSDHESHLINQKSNIPNCTADEQVSNKQDDSGIVPKKCRVGDVSSNIEKETKDTETYKNCEESRQPTPQRITKKVGRGKFRRRLLKRSVEKPAVAPVDSDSDKNLDEIASKRKDEVKNLTSVENAETDKSVSLKRGHQSEKRKRTRNKVESVSEEENEEEVMGKRLKIKPRKILTSSRKKVEAKLNNLKDSSEDSEEAEVTPKKGTVKTKRTSSPKKESKEKTNKKVKKKQGNEGKKKGERPLGGTEADDTTPVRQSRRIAQLKIREEAERRQLEEVTLRELKMKHKKKLADGEEDGDWKAPSGSSGSEAEVEKPRGRGRNEWKQSDSSVPASDSDSDEPLFERDYEEPDLVFKSDHEFSPESDLEDGEVIEPLKRARTLKEEAEGFCVVCGRGDQPQWILLCDDCDAGYHASCLKPILFLVPDGDWFCPPCQHQRLIKALEAELVKYDVLAKVAEKEMKTRKSLELEKKEAEEKEKKLEAEDSEESSSAWSSSDEGTVYRLRERRQLPVSLRAQEYDRLMSSAIKEEYKEPTSTAGNQGRGKDISTIIEAAEEEKHKAELEAAQQSGATGGGEVKRSKLRRPRRKPRKLNSLEVVSEDNDDTDEDFKEAGWDTSSESISSDAEGDTDSDGRSSDSLPIRRSGRDAKKSRKRLVESPELKKKKGVFDETSSESSGAKDWSKKNKTPTKKKHHKTFPKKFKKKKGLKQYDAEGNVIRPRVKYGGLSGSEGSNDWSPKHRTRQKKINYTEMPNTESEDEMHKPSGKHMPDSSDEFRLDSEDTSASDSDRRRKRKPSGEDAEPEAIDDSKVNTLRELIRKTAVVPLHKLPEDVTKAKTEALEAQLNAKVEAVVGTATPSRPARGKGSRGGRGSRGPRGGGGGGRSSVRTPSTSTGTDTASSNLVGLKIKDLSQNAEPPLKPNQIERERKRQEREAKLAEKEARKLDRIKKKEEKDQQKEQKAKEREEKRLAKMALMESKKQRKEKFDALPVPIPIAGYGNPAARPHQDMQRMPMNINQQFAEFQRMRQPGGYEGAPRGPGGYEGRPRGPGGYEEAPRGPGEYEGAPRRPGGYEGTPRGSGGYEGSPRGPGGYAGAPRGPGGYEGAPRGPGVYEGAPRGPGGYEGIPRGPGDAPPPRLQVRPELRAMRPDLANVRAVPPPQYHHLPPHPRPPHHQRDPERREVALREGTLSVAGSPQPYKPATDPPSIITRMPHMIPQQYRGPTMYVGGTPYGPPPHGARPHMMYMHQPHPLDPSPSGGGPINVNNRAFAGGYYPRGYPPPRFPAEPSHHASTPPPTDSQPKIKSEIKTEPEATSSPSSSPARLSSPSQDEPVRPHPKIKHTESKERARTTAAARYPHGPYAPQYGPYGPYAPPGPDGYSGPMHPMQMPPRPLHSTPPPGVHPVHRLAPHPSGPTQPSHHVPPVSHHSAPHLHGGPPPLRHGPPPHHVPISQHPVRPHMPHPHPGLAAHQPHPQESPAHQQHPTNASTHQLHPSNVSAHQPHPPNVSAHQPHPPNVSAHEPHPPNVSAHQPHPPNVSAHQPHSPNSSTHQPHPPNVSTHQPHPPNVSTHQPHSPNHQSHPLNVSAHQPPPPNVSAHQPHPPNVSAHQSLPPNVSTHQSLPLTSHQPPPSTVSAHQSHSSSVTVNQLHPPNVSAHQIQPINMPAHQQQPPNVIVRQSQLPNVSGHQSHPPNASSHQPHPHNMSIHQSRPLDVSHPPDISVHKSLSTSSASLRPQPPSSPHTSVQSTPPPVLPCQTADHPSKVPIQPPTDSINLVSHNRLHSSPSPSPVRVTASPILHAVSEPDNSVPSQPIALKVSVASTDSNLTPIEATSSKVTILGSSEVVTNTRETVSESSTLCGKSPPASEGHGEDGAGGTAGSVREEEGGVFGGLVSYFSSQQEDDIDG